MTCCAFHLVGLITSYALIFDELTRACINQHVLENSESKDFFSVFLDHKFDVSLHQVDR